MKELKDYTTQELRGELNRRLRSRIPSEERPRCKTCKYCVSASTLAKMIKNKEIDTNMPSSLLHGHYCLLSRDVWRKEENEYIFDWTKKICDKYENKKNK